MMTMMALMMKTRVHSLIGVFGVQVCMVFSITAFSSDWLIIVCLFDLQIIIFPILPTYKIPLLQAAPVLMNLDLDTELPGDPSS